VEVAVHLLLKLVQAHKHETVAQVEVVRISTTATMDFQTAADMDSEVALVEVVVVLVAVAVLEQ